MPKSTDYKVELGTSLSPRIYRKGYLFRETGPDSSNNISRFSDEKSFYRASYDNDIFGIFSDLHYSEWDHSYGTTFEMNTVLPDDSSFFDEAWTKSTPAGSAGTASLSLNSATSTVRGNLHLTCTSAQTIAYAKTDIIDSTSTSGGRFTLEWALKKGNTESSNNNKFTIQVKFGQFHVKVEHGLNTQTFTEVGGTPVSITHTTNSTYAGISDGHYSKYRLIFDMQRSTKKCVFLINDKEEGSISKTQTNGNTTDNEVKFGYLATPTSTSITIMKYIRYHNVAMYPLEVPVVSLWPVAGMAVSGSQGSNVFTQSGSFSVHSIGQPTGNDRGTPGWGSVTNGSTPTLSRTSDFSTNAIGNAFEVRMRIVNSQTASKVTYLFEDGTRSVSLEVFGPGNTTLNDGIKFNGTTVSGFAASTFHTYRVVMRGTGTGNAKLYIDGNLAKTETASTVSANNKFTITYANSGGVASYSEQYVLLFNRPQHPTRWRNKCVMAYLNGTSESGTRYVASQVILNDLDDLIGTPKLASLRVFQKDLAWGDCGTQVMGNMEQRGSNSSFLTTDASPSWTAITPSDNQQKHDSYTKYMFDYFQVRCPFTTLMDELTFFVFHRQLDVTDYVTQWGTSTFERDFLSRKINVGDLRVTLMNPDDDFDTLRTRPDVWINAMWETWIGATTASGDEEYPDFIGTVDNIRFESNTPYAVLEVSNVIKKFKEITVNPTGPYPPFNTLRTFSGSDCNKVPVRTDTADTTVFILDSKYEADITDVYVNGVRQTSGYTTTRQVPVTIDFTTAPSGTVTADVTPIVPFMNANPATCLRTILQKDAGLHYGIDIDNVTLTDYETDIEGIAFKNIDISNQKLFDILETIAINGSCSLYVSSETQDALAFEIASKIRISSFTISDRNLSNAFDHCETISISNPIENCLNKIDFTFDQEAFKKNFTYINTRLVSDYDSTSPNAASSIISIFGIRSPSRRMTTNPSNFFNISLHYQHLDSVTDLEPVVDRNFAPYGFRPPLYDLNNVATNIFLYSFTDTLFIMRDSTTVADDTIEITRIEKDYDNLRGSITGFSNKFIQFGGSVATLLKTYAADATVCASSVTTPTCDVTGKTLNPSNPLDANGYFVAVGVEGDADQSMAGT